LPVHALLQQKPLTQAPLVHWLLPEQTLPLPSFAEQVLPLQKSAAMQSPSLEQDFRHVVIAALQLYGVHAAVAPPKLQLPLPSHCTWALATPFLHDAGEQTVPEG
jgi:hypothetical protein